MGGLVPESGQRLGLGCTNDGFGGNININANGNINVIIGAAESYYFLLSQIQCG